MTTKTVTAGNRIRLHSKQDLSARGIQKVTNLSLFYPEEDHADYDVDEYIYKIAGNQLYLYDFDSQTGEQELENVLTRQ